jgi:hypothetical protein
VTAPSSPIARRLDLALVVLAVLAAATAGLHDLGRPWDGSLRGLIVSNYSHRFVQQHLELGLQATRGACITSIDPLAPDRPYLYGNHPATCTLLLLPFALLFGEGEDTLRVAATLLWLPAVLALWRLAWRWCAPPAPGAAALLLATLPVNAIWGPSPHVHCAVLAALLLAALAFVRQLEQPGRGRATLLALAVTFACLTDWPGMFVLALLGGLALAWPDPRRALRVALWTAPCALVALAAIHAHAVWFTRGAIDARDWWLGLLGGTRGFDPDGAAWLAAHAAHVREGLGPWPLALAAAGALLAAREGRPGRRRLVAAGALMLPGLLNIALFEHHAIVHPFWGMYGTAGLALLAAAPLGGVFERAPGPRVAGGSVARWRAAAGLLLVLLAAALGLRQALAATTAARTTVFSELGALLDQRYGPGDLVAASVDLAPADIYTRAVIVGPVATPSQAEALHARYAPPAFIGRLGFVLPAHQEGDALAQRLGAFVAPRRCGRWLVFDLR